MSYHGTKQIINAFFCAVTLTELQQSSVAFQPIPKISFIEQNTQKKGVHSTSIQIAKYIHDNDSNEPTLATDRRSMIKATVSTLLFTCAFTREQETSNAVPGLVQFPCNHRLMNTYHFMRSGQSILENKDIISTNPLFLTNREDALSPLGVKQVEDVCRDMIARDVNPSVVKYSLAAKSIQSADIVASEVTIGRNRLVPEYTFMDPRGIGKWDMQRLSVTEEAVWALDHARAGKDGIEGLPPSHDDGTPNETLSNQVTRLRELLSVLETHCSGDTILLIFPDGTGPALLSALIAGIPLYRVHELNFAPGEIRYNITATRVLQDLPNEPLPSYKAAIARGTATLERYEADPNQFLDLQEEERLIEEEEFRKRLIKREADLREEAKVSKEDQRNLARKNSELRKKEEKITQEEPRKKQLNEKTDSREKKTTKEKISKTSENKVIGGKVEGSKNPYEARSIPNERKNAIDKPKDKMVVEDGQIVYNTIGSSQDSSIATFALVGAMAAFKQGVDRNKSVIFEGKHEFAGNTMPVSQNLGNATVGLDTHKIKEDNLDSKTCTEQTGKLKINEKKSKLHSSTSFGPVEIKHKHSSGAGIQEMENITAATTVKTNDMNDNKSEEQSFGSKVNPGQIDSDDTAEMDIMALPEIQKLQNLDEAPPFDIPELTMDLNKEEAGKSEKEERIANANKVMEEYLSQDDGASDWLELMSDLMDSQ